MFCTVGVIQTADTTETTETTTSHSAGSGERCRWKRPSKRAGGAGAKLKTGVAEGAKVEVGPLMPSPKLTSRLGRNPAKEEESNSKSGVCVLSIVCVESVMMVWELKFEYQDLKAFMPGQHGESLQEDYALSLP